MSACIQSRSKIHQPQLSREPSPPYQCVLLCAAPHKERPLLAPPPHPGLRPRAIIHVLAHPHAMLARVADGSSTSPLPAGPLARVVGVQ